MRVFSRFGQQAINVDRYSGELVSGPRPSDVIAETDDEVTCVTHVKKRRQQTKMRFDTAQSASLPLIFHFFIEQFIVNKKRTLSWIVATRLWIDTEWITLESVLSRTAERNVISAVHDFCKDDVKNKSSRVCSTSTSHCSVLPARQSIPLLDNCLLTVKLTLAWQPLGIFHPILFYQFKQVLTSYFVMSWILNACRYFKLGTYAAH